jgi:hypothetical protein
MQSFLTLSALPSSLVQIFSCMYKVLSKDVTDYKNISKSPVRTEKCRVSNCIEICEKNKNIDLYKVKVKFSLCFTKHHAMKAYCGSGVIAPRIL